MSNNDEIKSHAKVDLCAPNLKGNELRYVSDAIKSGWVSGAGEYVSRFEKAISDYVGAQDAVACQSGTAGLHLSLIALGLQANDEIIVPTVTFVAAVNPVRYVGAYPIFMDCDDSLCMNAEKLEDFFNEKCVFDGEILKNKLTNRRIKLIIVVHVFGNMGNMCKILRLAEFYKLKVIEDATEALGTYYKSGLLKGKYAGTMGDIGVFSFNANKIITTGGGGAVVSHEKKILDKVRFFSTQAKNDSFYFIHNEIGFNYRMSNVQAAIGLAQIEQIEEFVKIKNKNYNSYKKHGINLLPFDEKIRSNKWFYAHLAQKKEELMKHLMKNNIEVRPLWMLVHLQKCYKCFQSYKIEKANYFLKRIVNLPCGSGLSESSIVKIAEIIKNFYDF
ncbi:MAG: LegC family aminotransferase [Oscillospiraceae bacterium]|jgi:perosamine synthetase|nr:LegC family aminotransferase [Oscillospiraceae bacterium]